MRKTILAAVILCPMLIHAQVNSPAQPQSAGTNPVLESRLTTPKAPGVSSDTTTAPVRISSGVTFPKLIETAEIFESKDWRWLSPVAEKVAVINLIVDPTGKPSQLHLVQSLGAGVDEDILAAVSRYRFVPGMLNHQPIPIEVNLTVRILSRLGPEL
jgi:hypothetical protein